ncbi:hypothetical protein M0813_30284 [Anaeramoeba flamelloides]|uniref:Uncharacterized protein n=1 Tax=Anaeramoeba flamelloides TaxID=1746091 RepID=A0ABQ8XKZ8_9EUKA|nr:hypothetical protein M0813_30284 [Anaeramoeba flamelloides]
MITKKPMIFWIDRRFENATKRKKIVSPISNSFTIKKFCTGIEAYYSFHKLPKEIEILIVSSKDYQKDTRIKKKFLEHFKTLTIFIVNFEIHNQKYKKKKKKNETKRKKN